MLKKSEQLVHSSICLSFEQTTRHERYKKKSNRINKVREKNRLQVAEKKPMWFYSA